MPNQYAQYDWHNIQSFTKNRVMTIKTKIGLYTNFYDSFYCFIYFCLFSGHYNDRVKGVLNPNF